MFKPERDVSFDEICVIIEFCFYVYWRSVAGLSSLFSLICVEESSCLQFTSLIGYMRNHSSSACVMVIGCNLSKCYPDGCLNSIFDWQQICSTSWRKHCTSFNRGPTKLAFSSIAYMRSCMLSHSALEIATFSSSQERCSSSEAISSLSERNSSYMFSQAMSYFRDISLVSRSTGDD